LLVQELCCAHVNQFDIACLPDHDVLGFCVAVDDLVRVQVLQAQNHLRNVEPRLVLI
jgi:hypothetical protein